MSINVKCSSTFQYFLTTTLAISAMTLFLWGKLSMFSSSLTLLSKMCEEDSVQMVPAGVKSKLSICLMASPLHHPQFQMCREGGGCLQVSVS